MIDSTLEYLLLICFISAIIGLLEFKLKLKIFKYIPAIVFIYIIFMLIGSNSIINFTDQIKDTYTNLKNNLLSAMLFLFMLQIDFKSFFSLSKKILLSYFFSVFSIVLAFIIMFVLFSYTSDEIGIFSTLAASWLGGSANMVAIASALEVSEEDLGIALVIDTINYSLWFTFLLFISAYSNKINRFFNSSEQIDILENIACSCTIGVKRYYLFLSISLVVAFISIVLSKIVVIYSSSTSMILFATSFGILGSFTKLKNINGSNDLAISMLYLLIALIASKANIDNFSNLYIYVFAGFVVLLIHAFIMFSVAKIFRLDMFSIGVSSLANIGGIASAPILASTYNKALIPFGVVLALMGYLVGTFVALFLAYILRLLF